MSCEAETTHQYASSKAGIKERWKANPDDDLGVAAVKEEKRRYQLFLCHNPSKFIVCDNEIFSTDKGRRAIQEQALPHKSDQPLI